LQNVDILQTGYCLEETKKRNALVTGTELKNKNLKVQGMTNTFCLIFEDIFYSLYKFSFSCLNSFSAKRDRRMLGCDTKLHSSVCMIQIIDEVVRT